MAIVDLQVKIDELSSFPVTVKQLKQQLTENERQMAVLQDEGMCIYLYKLMQETFWLKSPLHVLCWHVKN